MNRAEITFVTIIIFTIFIYLLVSFVWHHVRLRAALDQRLGMRNAVQQEEDGKQICITCGKRVDPEIDVFIGNAWHHADTASCETQKTNQPKGQTP